MAFLFFYIVYQLNTDRPVSKEIKLDRWLWFGLVAERLVRLGLAYRMLHTRVSVRAS